MTWVDTLDSYAVQGPGRTFHLLVKEIVIGRGGGCFRRGPARTSEKAISLTQCHSKKW